MGYFWLLIYIYCCPFKPILGFLGFGGDPLAPFKKMGFFEWIFKNYNLIFTNNIKVIQRSSSGDENDTDIDDQNEGITNPQKPIFKTHL